MLYIIIPLALFFLFIVTLGLLGVFDYPKSKPNTNGEDRFLLIYQSPRHGTCRHGSCCDICDGKRAIGYPYGHNLKQAREISKDICREDTLALVHIVNINNW